MNKMKSYIKLVLVGAIGVVMLTGCGMQQPKPLPLPTDIEAPQAIMDNSGMYMCPFTQDEVMAEWTDKAINVSTSASVGSAVGAYAGQRALSFIPFVGGMLGQKAGAAIARKVALESIGGEEFIKESSDISFNNLGDLGVYMYVKFSSNENYADALSATMKIYPDLNYQVYMNAIRLAPAAVHHVEPNIESIENNANTVTTNEASASFVKAQ
ncbi:hypothetical protein N9A28_03255 [Sulfurimonas sp.]|nr:hypothetical protein [Sulfurimonas sp.]